ncbi:MAG: Ig-like domain-containing protein, partial [Bacteroidota bacterium]
NPYKEKFLISTSGTTANPIKIIGIAGPNGEKPIIDGDHANAISGQMCYAQTQPYGLIFIEPGVDGNGNCPNGSYSAIPHDIVIDGLEIRNAHSNFTFSVNNGVQQSYDVFSCGIYAERVQNLVVRNCNFNHCGLGLFINSKFGTHALSKNILVERNYFTQNGLVGDGHLHNSYIEAEDVIYQYNFYDHLVWGSYGASIKDRSAGNIIRYNWIVASDGHAIQIPEAQGGQGYLDQLPKYKETFVYGNIIYNSKQGAARIVRYGGDQGIYQNYRQGTLYFYNNTLIDEGDKIGAPGANRYQTAVFLLPDKGEVGDIPIVEKVDCRNNVIYNTNATAGFPATTLCLMSTDLTGTVNMTNNWRSPGIVDFVAYYQSTNTGTVTHTNSIYGNAGQNLPNFNNYLTQDYSLSPNSNAVNQGTILINAAVGHPVLEEYVKDFLSKPRNTVGPIDLGAYENMLVPPIAVTNMTILPTTLSIGMGQNTQLTATILPANASDKTIIWTSSNSAIASVINGQITGVSGGITTITATTNDGGFSASCQVTVKQTIVQWDFKNQSRNASLGLSANLLQQISRENTYTGTYDFTTTGANGTGDFCLSSPNWDNGMNNDYWLINFTTLGFQNLKISSIQRGSGVGPSDFKIQYRIGNTGIWTDLTTVKALTDWVSGVISNLTLPVTCDNQSNMQIRWLLTSNTAVNNAPILSTGNGRIDEIIVIGDPLPPCPNTYSFAGNILTGKYDAATFIITQNNTLTQVISGSDVILNGGNFITLQPNFEAQANSLFKAYIGGCGY